MTTVVVEDIIGPVVYPKPQQAVLTTDGNNVVDIVTAGTQGPKGDKGDTGNTGATGAAATITVGTVTTGSAGSSAVITNGGTSGAAVFNFTIPRGDTGATGATGPQGSTGAAGAAATIAAGTTTTGSAGSNATVANSGSSSAAVFDFTIPRGDTGATGATGSTGAAGADGKTVRNSSGTPSSGTGVDGDFNIDTLNQKIFGPKASGAWGSGTSLIGAAGADGATSNQELGYAQITSSFTTANAWGTVADVTGLSVTVTVGTRPIKVIFDCEQLGNSSTGGATLWLKQDSGAYDIMGQSIGLASGAGHPCHREVRFTPSAGSHTYQLGLTRAFGQSAGNATITCASGAQAAFIQVVEL